MTNDNCLLVVSDDGMKEVQIYDMIIFISTLYEHKILVNGQNPRRSLNSQKKYIKHNTVAMMTSNDNYNKLHLNTLIFFVVWTEKFKKAKL